MKSERPKSISFISASSLLEVNRKFCEIAIGIDVKTRKLIII